MMKKVILMGILLMGINLSFANQRHSSTNLSMQHHKNIVSKKIVKQTSPGSKMYPNLAGDWVLEAHLNDGRVGVQLVQLEQTGIHLTGTTFYLIDPTTGEKNPKKAASLSKLTGSIFPNDAFPIVTLTRLLPEKSFIAVFTGNFIRAANQEMIKGYFVNTGNRSGQYTMKRVAQSRYMKLAKRASQQ